MASPARKLLRLAVVRDARILEERLLGGQGPVTIGRGAKNTVVLPSTEAPASVTLFMGQADGVRLLRADEVTGKVAMDPEWDSPTPLTSAFGGQHTLKLPESARGALEVGGLTLLFQFVPPPPRIEGLPRGSKLKHVDKLFLGVLAASLLVHLVSGAWLFDQPRPAEPELALDALPDRFARLLVQPLPKPAEPPPSLSDETSESDTTANAKKAEGKKEPDRTPPPSTRRRELEQKVATKGLLNVLGGMGAGSGTTAFADLIGPDGGTTDIDVALAGASGVGVMSADASGVIPARGGATGQIAGIGELGTSGGGPVELGAKKEVQVTGRVQDLAPEVESVDVDRDAIAQYVKARLRAIQNCYEKELKRNPKLRGKVAVRFAIGTTGRATSVEIEENTVGNEAVGACIRTVIRGWSFPFRPPEPVPVSYPFVFSPAG